MIAVGGAGPLRRTGRPGTSRGRAPAAVVGYRPEASCNGCAGFNRRGTRAAFRFLFPFTHWT